MPPTAECVVDTGNPNLEAIKTQMIDAIIQSITAAEISITGYKIIKMDFGTSRVYREEKVPTDYTGELAMEFWIVKT